METPLLFAIAQILVGTLLTLGGMVYIAFPERYLTFVFRVQRKMFGRWIARLQRFDRAMRLMTPVGIALVVIGAAFAVSGMFRF